MLRALGKEVGKPNLRKTLWFREGWEAESCRTMESPLKGYEALLALECSICVWATTKGAEWKLNKVL